MERGIIDTIKGVARGQFLAGEPLERHCSFRIGGPADLFFVPAGREDFLASWKVLGAARVQSLVIGNGTNVLFGDAGVRGAVLRLKDGFDHLRISDMDEAKKTVVLEVGAGVPLARLHLFASKKGFLGTEFTFGIPGTVGGAIFCNAGTRLGTMSGIASEIEVAGPDGKARWLGAAGAGFGYRTCRLLPGSAVLGARVGLAIGGRDVATTDVRELKAYRAKCQPLGRPSAGSVFRNPEGDFAGRLIEASGLKGLRLGGAEVSPVHANFIVNRGRATAAQVKRLMEIVRAEVERTQKVRLEPEIHVLGDFLKEEQ
ncbi:MAG: UDP-N-acetylmuramate dehydrogenase [Deltaproteobacteria bacterium]|nr:UDP-N-acetylmuramate dehydrogenase [Deltaproteobacteria bacterium]